MASAPQIPFEQNQLALISVLASPALGSVLATINRERSSMRLGDRLNDQFARAGVALAPGTEVSLGDPGAEGKVTILICVAWSDTGPSHCTAVNFQSPITFG